MKSAKDPLGLYPEPGETLGDLMYKIRNHCKAKGIEGFAAPDPHNPGAYFVYGPHRLLGCVATEMQAPDWSAQLLNSAMPALDAAEAQKWYDAEQARFCAEFEAHAKLRVTNDARFQAELEDAQRMFDLAKAEGDHLGAAQFSARIRQCQLNLARK